MRKLLMAGAICSLAFACLYATPEKAKNVKCCHHEHHEALKKIHADMHEKFAALDGLRNNIKNAGTDAEAVKAIYAFLNEKYELVKELHAKVKEYHAEELQKHIGEGHTAACQKYHAAMKKLHAKMHANFSALAGKLEAIKAAIDHGDLKGAVKAISAYLNESHKLHKEFHSEMKKHHEAQERKHIGKGHDAACKKNHEECKKIHADMHKKFAVLAKMLKAIENNANTGNVHGAVEATSAYLDKKYELHKECCATIKSHHETMAAKPCATCKLYEGKKVHEVKCTHKTTCAHHKVTCAKCKNPKCKCPKCKSHKAKCKKGVSKKATRKTHKAKAVEPVETPEVEAPTAVAVE